MSCSELTGILQRQKLHATVIFLARCRFASVEVTRDQINHTLGQQCPVRVYLLVDALLFSWPESDKAELMGGTWASTTGI
jgi:hypothetical protein